jgi:hypothetical protein
VTAVALIDHGRENFVCELRPHRIPIGPLSPEALVALLRTYRHHGDTP